MTQRGFTLIEAMVALVLITIAMGPVFILATSSVNVASRIEHNLIASDLAQEGIEVIANDLTSTPGTAGRRNPAGYRAFRGLMSWSINWERLANLDFSRNHRAYLNALPPP